MATFGDRIKSAWNIFLNPEPYRYDPPEGLSYGRKPDVHRLGFGTEKTMISSIYTRIATDVAAISMRHVRIDGETGRYISDIPSRLNKCLTEKANIDQEARAFMVDAVLSLLDEGVIAIVPVDTTINPRVTGSYDIDTLRVAKIIEWKPSRVKLQLYDQNDGQRKEVEVPKRIVAIVENPFFAVMNEPNSTLSRLRRKLQQMDSIEDAASSGKLDLIFQLPYAVKSETRRDQANRRQKEIEVQLEGSRYGVAWVDATEKITQLNRPVENTLLTTVQYLTDQLYAQLGVTKEILDGTADEKTMINYYNRTVEPILGAFAEAFRSSFLTKTARAQGQSIMYFRDPFRLVPLADLAEIADKLTRNAILSSNEFRAIMGFRPSKDPEADKLRNKNLNPPTSDEENPIPREESQNET